MRDIQKEIGDLVQGNRVVLFMKGNKGMPQCGFSARALQVLQHYTNEFVTVDVLKDPEVRQGIKAFSSWPTIPQCYVDGKFVGGSDILIEMHEAGELEKLLAPKA
jgi:monothiol glutaredoxin